MFVLLEYYFVSTNNFQGALFILLLTNTIKLNNHVYYTLLKGIKNNHSDFKLISEQLYSNTFVI